MKNKKKGFTLAELLIVVAIIAVLVLIAIPVFTKSMNKAKAGADEANCRSLYADIQTTFLSDGSVDLSEFGITADTAATTFTLSDGTTVKLQYGEVTVEENKTNDTIDSYTVTYKAKSQVLKDSANSATDTAKFGK